jgi:hypothetical protein
LANLLQFAPAATDGSSGSSSNTWPPERDDPCDGLLDAWVWSHREAFFDG